MRGRPKRAADKELADRLRTFRHARALSLRRCAQRLGIEASTLTRSLKADAFSADTARRLELALTAEGVPKEAGPTMAVPNGVLQHLMHLLRESTAVLAPYQGAGSPDAGNEDGKDAQ